MGSLSSFSLTERSLGCSSCTLASRVDKFSPLSKRPAIEVVVSFGGFIFRMAPFVLLTLGLGEALGLGLEKIKFLSLSSELSTSAKVSVGLGAA